MAAPASAHAIVRDREEWRWELWNHRLDHGLSSRSDELETYLSNATGVIHKYIWSAPLDLDLSKWKVEVQQRAFPYTFSHYTMKSYANEYIVTVLMEYNGVHINVGTIKLKVLHNGLLYVNLFENLFKTEPALVLWHVRYIPHVEIAGLMTSALFCLVSSIAQANKRISLEAVNLLASGDDDEDERRQTHLEDHYASLGFRRLGRGQEGTIMRTKIVNFLSCTKPLVEGRPTFVFDESTVIKR